MKKANNMQHSEQPEPSPPVAVNGACGRCACTMMGLDQGAAGRLGTCP